jgi:putative SOS response-associated peptidase YedK
MDAISRARQTAKSRSSSHFPAIPYSAVMNPVTLLRTFAIITTDANDLVADIHDRMPVILSRYDYARSLGEEPDPRDLMRPCRADADGRSRPASISQRTMTPRYSIRSS